MIYVLLEAETWLYKVGYCVNRGELLTRRLRSIQCERTNQAGEKRTLSLFLDVDWDHREEQKIHRFLHASWAGGEWFRDGERLQEVLSYMRSSYFRWLRRFAEVEAELPPRSHWMRRDATMGGRRKIGVDSR
jgi:hypothetical protein